MVKELVDLINKERPPSAIPLDNDHVTIRCLPHVLHLAVIDLLKALKSLAEDEELDIGLDSLTEDQAEQLHADRKAGEDESEEFELSDADLGHAADNIVIWQHRAHLLIPAVQFGGRAFGRHIAASDGNVVLIIVFVRQCVDKGVPTTRDPRWFKEVRVLFKYP
jgi:hypothetical protein